jgi:uncharacterized DUF497 family protein
MRFEWDPDKAKTNLNNHKISFEEAQTVFDDPLYIIFADPDHSIEEYRFIVMGASVKHRLLVVSYTERPPVTRLISARKATRSERKNYEEEI